MTEYEIVGWHHQLSQHGFEQTLGGNEGQGSLVCCSSWLHEELDTTKGLSNNKPIRTYCVAQGTWLNVP